jgi:hypothetical protein
VWLFQVGVVNPGCDVDQLHCKRLINNQQWTTPGGTVRLIDFGEKRYVEEVPHDRSGLYAEAWDNMGKVNPKCGTT